MNGALCPNCTDALGELISRKLDDPSGVVATVECPNCDHRWSIGL